MAQHRRDGACGLPCLHARPGCSHAACACLACDAALGSHMQQAGALDPLGAQAEFLQSRLNQVKERIDDVEDLLNMELDQR